MQTYKISSVLDEAEDKEHIGKTVPHLEPNVFGEGKWFDAETGEFLFMVSRFPGDLETYRQAVLGLKMSTVIRSKTYRSASVVFGYKAPRPAMKREGCTASSLSASQPYNHTVIENVAKELEAFLILHFPERHENWMKEVEGVESDWRLNGDSLWTSGVVNKTTQLPYHRDRNNFPVISAMPWLVSGVLGGHLHLPKYDKTIKCQDGMVVWFVGRNVTHGVTEILSAKPTDYRFSIVYYSLLGIKDCATAAIEVGLARERRTAREQKIRDDIVREQSEG